MTFTWRWWVVRDDGDRVSGPFGTEAEARAKLRAVFDASEYRVDYQYGPSHPVEQPKTDKERDRLAQLLRQALGKRRVVAQSERDESR